MSAARAASPDAVPAAVLARFGFGAATTTPIVAGHINRTWRVDHANGSAVLQWINGGVFPDAVRVVRNTAAVTRHVRARAPFVPVQLAALDGEDFACDAAGEVWRATAFVPDARTLLAPARRSEANAAGAAFGRFLHLTADFDTTGMVPAIRDFHALRPRLVAFDAALESAAHVRARAAPDVLAAIARHRDALVALPFASLPQRLIHGDCKVSNLLLHATRDEALAVLDLDTVMQATPLFDFGDLVRSACALAPEDEPDVARVGIDEGWFAAITHGFLGALGAPLASDERALLVPACAYIAFMLGVRFATDHLAGDVYFRIRRPGQNLDRARGQLRMAELYLQRQARLQRLLEGAA